MRFIPAQSKPLAADGWPWIWLVLWPAQFVPHMDTKQQMNKRQRQI